MKAQRNAPCPCGSGKKFKHCCLNKAEKSSLGQKLVLVGVVAILGIGAIAVFLAARDGASGDGPRQVWSEEHQHWHTEP